MKMTGFDSATLGPWEYVKATLDGWIVLAAGIAYTGWHFAQPLTEWFRNPTFDLIAAFPVAYGLWRVSAVGVRRVTGTNGAEHPTIAVGIDVAIALMVALLLT